MVKAPMPMKVSWHSETWPAYPTRRTSDSPTMPKARPWESVARAVSPAMTARTAVPADEEHGPGDATGVP